MQYAHAARCTLPTAHCSPGSDPSPGAEDISRFVHTSISVIYPTYVIAIRLSGFPPRTPRTTFGTGNVPVFFCFAFNATAVAATWRLLIVHFADPLSVAIGYG